MAKKENLQMGLSLNVDLEAFEEEWKNKQADIQSIIDKHTFQVRISGLEGLDKIKRQLQEIQQLQKGAAKPISQRMLLRENLLHEERLLVAEQKIATERQRTAAATALREKRELSLNSAKMKNISATKAQTQAYQAQSGVLNGLKQFMNSYISLLGGVRLLSNIKNITAEFELQRVSLRAITQDAAFADSLFAKIKATAVESPFATKDLVTYTKQLAAYRIENEELYGTMQMLADVSAGLGVGMDRLILAYGQVKAASVLRGTELRQFTEAGIPLVDELAKKFSQLRGEVVTTGEVFDLISTRQVPFEMVADIFKEMTAEGGRFYEMQKKQSESLYGVFENLKDNIQNAYDEIGQSNRGLLMGLGKLATVGAKNFDILAAAIAPLIVGMGAYRAATVLATKGTLGLSLSSNLLAKAEAALNLNRVSSNAQLRVQNKLMIRAAALQNKYAIAVLKANAAQNVFIRGLYLLKAAIIANPIGAALVGITAVVSALSAYGDKLRSVDAAQERAAKSGEEFKKAVEQDYKLERYNKIVDSLKEQETLLQSAKMSYTEFAKIFPELASRYKTQESRERAISQAQSKHQQGISALKTEYTSYFGYLDSEKSKVADLARGYADLDETMRTAQITRLTAALDEAEDDLAKYQKRSGRALNRWAAGEGWWKIVNPSGFILSALGVPLNASKEKIGSTEAEISSYKSQIEALKKASEDAEQAMIRWRKSYKELVDKTISTEELANLSFANAAEKAFKKLKELTEEQQRLSSVPKQERDSNIEDRLKTLSTLIPNVQKWLDIYKQTELKRSNITTPLENLKSELSLVEKIYKRYTELRQFMSNSAAQSQISKIYGGLTDIDFLDPKKLKERLQKMLSLAKAMGPKGEQFAIELGLKIQDIDLNEAKDKLERALDNISQQIKQQQHASEFFEKMLGLTGDMELSTRLALAVTGVTVSDAGVGGLFSQKLAEILAQEPVAVVVPADFQVEGEWNVANIQKAINSGKVTVEQIRDVVENLRATGKKDLAKTLEDSLEQLSDYSGNALSKMYDVLRQYDAIEQKRADITTDANNKIRTLEKGLVEAAKTMGGAELEALKERTNSAIEGINASAKLELFRLEDDYIRFFTSIYSMSVENAMIMKNKIKNALYQAFKDGAIDANDLRKELRAVDAQFEKLTESSSMFQVYAQKGLDGLIEKYKELANNLETVGAKMSSMKDSSNVAEEDKNFIDSALKKFAPEHKGTKVNSYEKLFETFAGDSKKMGGFLQKAGSNLEQGAQGFQKSVGTIDSIIKNVHGAITGIQNLIDQLNETRSEENKIGDVWRYVSDFDKYAASGWEKFKSGNYLGAVFDVASSIVSIFNNAQKSKIKWFNKQIEEQAEVIYYLERAYDRLERSQESLVGTEWVRVQKEQLEILQTQIKAARHQITLEKAKGKSSDKEAIKDFEETLIDLENKYKDVQKELITEMAGTDLTSAAKDFAQAWLDAYLSFDNTMGAMKESFKEMMSNMVRNSMMAKLVQKRLEPVFAAIDKAYEDSALTPAEWQGIMNMGNRAIELLDDDLTHFADMLGLREQLGTQDTSNLTGIAKGVAQASEETVLTLAGYANSLLYYQIWLKNDVAAIRAILEGRIAAVSPAPTGEGGFNVGQLVSLQQQSLTQLQAINMNTGRSADSLSRLEDKIDSIISTAGTSSRKVVNTRLSN